MHKTPFKGGPWSQCREKAEPGRLYGVRQQGPLLKSVLLLFLVSSCDTGAFRLCMFVTEQMKFWHSYGFLQGVFSVVCAVWN